jgi:hypothetical protein
MAAHWQFKTKQKKKGGTSYHDTALAFTVPGSRQPPEDRPPGWPQDMRQAYRFA